MIRQPEGGKHLGQKKNVALLQRGKEELKGARFGVKKVRKISEGEGGGGGEQGKKADVIYRPEFEFSGLN